MAKQHPHMKPASKDLAPDPATSYERAKPEKEAGMGRLDNNIATPREEPDHIDQAVTNAQPPRQINAHDVLDERAARRADGARVIAAPGEKRRRPGKNQG